MPIAIRPFAAADLPLAARLVAAQHVGRRRAHPALPERFAQPRHALELLATAWAIDGACGTAAVVDETVRGFLLALPARDRPGATFVPAFGCAVDPTLPPETAVALHDALLALPRNAGLHEHHVTIDADAPALPAWHRRGFRAILTLAVAPTPAVAAPVDDCDIRLADAGDLPAVLALVAALRAHHRDLGGDFGAADGLAEAARQHDMLVDPRSGCWLAIRDGAAAGLVTIRPPDASVSPLHRPDDAVHLTDAVTLPAARRRSVGGTLVHAALGWARLIGYGTCVLHWHPDNRDGVRFWERLGFRAVAHQLVRHA